jgi:transposase
MKSFVGNWAKKASFSVALSIKSLVQTLCTRLKKAIEEAWDGLKSGDAFYYTDEFNVNWLLILRAMWSPKGQQVMIGPLGQSKRCYGIGAVNYYTGETVVLVRRRKRRKEIGGLLQALLYKHPEGTIYVAWDYANTHYDDEVEAVVIGAAGCLVLFYLPTYSPWLNPIEMLWRHFRREVTHCELFENVKALINATYEFFNRNIVITKDRISFY